ncbi:HAD family phosphatase, partial [Enterococcus faecalis]
AIAMASAHLTLLHFTYVDRLDDFLIVDSIEVLKIIGISMDGPKVLGPAGMEEEELDDLVVSSSALKNIEINHRQAQKG